MCVDSKEVPEDRPPINNLFLFGAGFTKAVFPCAPLNKDLFQELSKGSNSQLLKQYSEKYHTEDIEILLTYLDLEIARLEQDTPGQCTLAQDREDIQNQLAGYFQKFRFTCEALRKNKWLATFVELFQDHDAIISLNYDCFLEGLLDYYERWSPKGGYINVQSALDEDLPENSKGIQIYKIHGSENFWISPMTPNREQKDIGLVINDKIFPRSGKNCHFTYGIRQNETRSYIIAPSFIKCPHVRIADIINKAIKIAPFAKNLVIGGCGLRPEDGFLWQILASFLNSNNLPEKKLIVIDPAANNKNVESKITKYWVGSSQHFKICSIAETFQSGTDELLKTLTG